MLAGRMMQMMWDLLTQSLPFLPLVDWSLPALHARVSSFTPCDAPLPILQIGRLRIRGVQSLVQSRSQEQSLAQTQVPTNLQALGAEDRHSTAAHFHTAVSQHHLWAFCPVFPTRDRSRRDGVGLTSPLGTLHRPCPEGKLTGIQRWDCLAPSVSQRPLLLEEEWMDG